MITLLMINFLAGAVVSFLGSLPVGILNVTIVQISLQKGMRSALHFALACTIIELLYACLAVWMSTALPDLAAYKYLIQVVSIAVFLVAGVYYVRKKPSGPKPQQPLHTFYQGIILSIINVIAIPFWLLYTAVLSTYHWIDISSGLGMVYFIAGISLGTWLALMAFAWMSQTIHKRFSLQSSLMNKVIGVLFISSSLLEFIHLVK